MEEQVVTPSQDAEVAPPAETVAEAPVIEPVVETPEETAKKKTAQERINEITRLRREEERAREKAEREVEYWRAKALQAEPPKPKPVADDGRPKVANFTTVEEYEDALLNWHEGRRTRELTLAEEKKRKNELFEQFEEKAKKARAEYDDFDDVINRPIFTDTMKEVLLSSEHGPDFTYFIAKDSDLANRIARMPPGRQAYELGRLETEYLIAKKTKKVTAAPEPITPIGATGSPSKIDESTLSDDEWFKREQKRRLDKLKPKGG